MGELQDRNVIIYTTTINIFEVLRGLENPTDLPNALKFFNSLEVLSFDVESSIRYSEISRNLNKEGEPISFGDIFISGVFLSNNIKIIVSNNEVHFKKCGLKVESY